MKTILIAGAGQLGSRHLQALSYLDNTYQVLVYDVSVESLDTARERYDQVATTSSPHATFVQQLPKDLKIDVCIIATNAAIRYQLMKNILEHNDVQLMLLEKVLFQTLAQLESASELLDKHATKAWVNCPRRMFDLYQQLKVRLSGKRVDVKVTGHGWGLACNAVHHIDLWHFLNDSDTLLSAKFLEKSCVIDSKREGYQEVIGAMSADTGEHSDALYLECSQSADGSVKFEITLDTIDETIVINEIAGIMTIFNKHMEKSEKTSISVPFQSGLTNIFVENVLHGACLLSSYAESKTHHQLLLNAILPIFSREMSTETDIAPIT